MTFFIILCVFTIKYNKNESWFEKSSKCVPACSSDGSRLFHRRKKVLFQCLTYVQLKPAKRFVHPCERACKAVSPLRVMELQELKHQPRRVKKNDMTKAGVELYFFTQHVYVHFFFLCASFLFIP